MSLEKLGTFAGLERDLSHLEHLGARAAVRLHEVHAQVDVERGTTRHRLAYAERDPDGLADVRPPRLDRNVRDRDGIDRTEAEHLERGTVASLDGRTKRVRDQPPPLLARAPHPATAGRDEHVGVVLADVVEVVGDRTAHVEGRIVLEQLEELEHRPGVGLEPRQPRCPRQPWTRALAHEPADVRARIPRPHTQARECPIGLGLEEHPDRVLGREPLRRARTALASRSPNARARTRR